MPVQPLEINVHASVVQPGNELAKCTPPTGNPSWLTESRADLTLAHAEPDPGRPLAWNDHSRHGTHQGEPESGSSGSHTEPQARVVHQAMMRLAAAVAQAGG